MSRLRPVVIGLCAVIVAAAAVYLIAEMRGVRAIHSHNAIASRP